MFLIHQNKATIERLKAAEPPGGYKDINRIWYFGYFAVSTFLSIAAAYYLPELWLKRVPAEGLFFFVLGSFMAVGIFIIRRWHKKHNVI